jgi:hypothetical protein
MENLSIINATAVTSQTLVGHFFDEEQGLYPSGNCFSMKDENGDTYKILNFGIENLDLLLEMGILEFPVKIHPLSERHAVILDERIPNRFYWSSLCSSCTPIELLPIPQRIKHELRFKRGHSRNVEGVVMTNTGEINGIDINGDDYSKVKTEKIDQGLVEVISENRKIRYQEMLKPFVEAYKRRE